MKRKALWIFGFLFLLLLLFMGWRVFSHFQNTRKLESAEVSGEFVTDTIPFSVASTGHLLVQVKISGSDESYPFILDSGASNMLFKSHSSEFDLEESGFSYGYGSNGKFFHTGITGLSRVQVGDVVFENVGLKEVEMNFSCMDHIYGIIGQGIMRHLIWQIDFEKNIIAVSKQLKDLSFGEKKIELSLSENRISHHLKVPLQLSEDGAPLEVILDLGSNGTLSLNESELLDNVEDPEVKAVLGRASEGLGDADDSGPSEKFYFLDSLSLGRSGFQLHNFKVLSHSQGMNLLGLGFFRNYKTTISWKDRKLILEPYSEIQNFVGKTTGFALNFDEDREKVLIISVLEDSPATQLDLQVGSEVLSINGVEVTRENFCNFQSSSNYQSDTLELRVKHQAVSRDIQLIKAPVF